MQRTRLIEAIWSKPSPLVPYAFEEYALAVDMAYTPDAQELYFLGRAPSAWAPSDPSLDLFRIRRGPTDRSSSR